jgi:hypothetical protein
MRQYDDSDFEDYEPDVDWAGEPNQDDAPDDSENTGIYQGGYRVYRDGSYREDFRSDA